MKRNLNESVVCVVGLGYVGLPLAQAFAKSLRVIGFDVNDATIKKLNQSNDNPNLTFTSHPKKISKAGFIIICVPTPLTKSKDPDPSCIRSAAVTIRQNMRKGSVVVLESSVYPGVTEDILKPILEEFGLKCGKDFKIAYSPERVNPGDKKHSVDKITKVVAGMDEGTTELVSKLYHKISPNIFVAKDIKTAEAAKVIENIQRDLNIALMNELALIFDKMGLNTKDVLDAATTKWNFQRYSPGLVGGHCIPVDPYYLTYKAKELGYHPQVILAGRAVNDAIPEHIANMTIKSINSVGKVVKGSRVLIMGLTYKANVADTRESSVKGIIKTLREYGVEIYGYDPLLDDIEAQFGIKYVSKLERIKNIDCIILSVAHDAFKKITSNTLRKLMSSDPIVIDVPGFFDADVIGRANIQYRCL